MATRKSKDTTIKCAPEKFYKFFNERSNDLPKASTIVQKIELVPPTTEWVNAVGTGKRYYFYPDGIDQTEMIADEVAAVDDHSMTTTFTVKEGQILQAYKDVELTFVVKANQIVTWTIKFEKIRQSMPDPDAYLDVLGKISKDVSDYVLKHG